MSAGGLFTLIMNNGREDQMLMASEMLNRCINDNLRRKTIHPGIRREMMRFKLRQIIKQRTYKLALIKIVILKY